MKIYKYTYCLLAAVIGAVAQARAADPVTVAFQNGDQAFVGTRKFFRLEVTYAP